MMPRGARLVIVISILIAAGSAVNGQVINDGFPGENTAELDARFATVLGMHPNIVVLMAGTNDALNTAKLLGLDVSRANVQDMITRAHDAGVKLVLVTVHAPDVERLFTRHKAADYGNNPPLQRVAALNDMLRAVAHQNAIPLVDFATVLAANGGATPGLSTDGVHLTRSGNGLLASAVYAELPKPLSPSTRIVCFGDSLTYGTGVRAPGNAPETDDTYPAQLRVLLQR
jgi:acyl-CoA thioesterase I